MDERIRDRRRSVMRQRGRHRAAFFLVAVLLLAAAGLFLWLRSSDVFAVERVTATVTQHVGRDQIAALVSPALGVSLLRLSVGSIKESLSGLAYVRSVEVYRRFPDTLDIRLVEYEPFARLKTEDGAVWLVAEDGRVLEKVRPPRGAGLPLVVYDGSLTLEAGETLPTTVVTALPAVALTESADFREDLGPVERTVVSAAGTVVLVLQGGVELRLGEPAGLDYKLTVAKDIFNQYLMDGRRIEYIDLSVPERVAVRAG